LRRAGPHRRARPRAEMRRVAVGCLARHRRGDHRSLSETGSGKIMNQKMLAALALVATLWVQSARAAETITLGLVAKLALQWPVYAALDKGYFERAGVKLDIVTTGGSAKAAQQLA